jgi:hypothetical protein
MGWGLDGGPVRSIQRTEKKHAHEVGFRPCPRPCLQRLLSIAQTQRESFMYAVSRLKFAVLAVFGLALLLSVPTAAWAEQGVNGRNVTVVQTPQTKFSLLAGRAWVEQGNGGGGVFNFTENNRDDWSVYLSDNSRGVQLQLDLHQRMVFYSDATSPRRPLYPINGSSAVVNGRNVISVGLQTGQIRMTGQNTWVEQGNDGGQFNFVEDNRDDWSVYLSDASRGVRLQIDIHRKLVLYADGGAPNMRPLYPIVSMSATD